MNSKTAIPRFLLPQITWRAQNSHQILKPLSRSSLPAVKPLQNHERHQRRGITSTAPKTCHLNNRRLAASCASQAQLTGSIFAALVSSSQAPAVSPIDRQLGRRMFHSSKPLLRDHHFDTLKFVQKLKDEGFSEEQATAMMRVLSDVIEESIQNLTRTMVLREDAERATYTQKVDFTKLRSELLSADSAEGALTRASHERLQNDLAKLQSRLKDEIGRTQASVRLDLSLEKGRIKEEASAQELKIKETNARIEQEVAGLRERIEGVKFSTLQWLM
jgi:hypothetical protein